MLHRDATRSSLVLGVGADLITLIVTKYNVSWLSSDLDIYFFSVFTLIRGWTTLMRPNKESISYLQRRVMCQKVSCLQPMRWIRHSFVVRRPLYDPLKCVFHKQNKFIRLIKYQNGGKEANKLPVFSAVATVFWDFFFRLLGGFKFGKARRLFRWCL